MFASSKFVSGRSIAGTNHSTRNALIAKREVAFESSPHLANLDCRNLLSQLQEVNRLLCSLSRLTAKARITLTIAKLLFITEYLLEPFVEQVRQRKLPAILARGFASFVFVATSGFQVRLGLFGGHLAAGSRFDLLYGLAVSLP